MIAGTRVVHINDRIPDAVYIGRKNPRRGVPGSIWGNPYVIGARVPNALGGTRGSKMTRADVLTMYRYYLHERPDLWARLPELRGKALACWCRRDGQRVTEDNRCHGDLLADLVNAHTDEELLDMMPSGA